jgi:hypothetical protein
MKKYVQKFHRLFILIPVIVVFKVWLTVQPLSTGDWPFLFNETIKEFPLIPAIRTGSYFPLSFFYQSTAKKLAGLSFSWPLIERLIWFWPFLIVTIFSAWHLAKTLFPKEKIIHFLAPCIFLFNTYILMVVGGGQMGVAMAYSLAPLVLAKFITGGSIFAGLLLAVQIMFDPRISLITLLATFIYFLFQYKGELTKYVKNFIWPVIISLGLHLTWIIPAVISKTTFMPESYQQSGWLGFLSVAEFSKTLSLLHPNWPENIFGKTYLMRPEFLVLPILAFGSLLFIPDASNSRVKKNVLFFSLLALAGAFLAKGTNPPFGQIYLWLFKYFPGMNLFRDPTKFYLLATLSFSILIPFTVAEVFKKLKSRGKLLAKVFVLSICFSLIYLVKPAMLNQLGGTFKAREVPGQYAVLKDYLYNQKTDFATLWIPQKQRFGFYSSSQSWYSLGDWVEDNKCLEPFCPLKITNFNREYFKCHPNEKCYPADASFLANPNSLAELKRLKVKYLIIPYDSEGEIFLYERKYDPEAREKLEIFLDTIPWLKKIPVADKIAVYEIK